MKKLLLVLVAFFALSFAAFGAVDLNTASKEELDAVKFIGPVKAQAIIDYRKKNGPFKSVDDLKNVRGFGDKTVAKIRSEVTVGGAASRADAKPAKSEEAPARADVKKDENAGAKKEEKAEKKADAKEKSEHKADVKKDDKADNKADSKADSKADKKKERAEKKAAKKKAKEEKKAAREKADKADKKEDKPAKK